MRLVANQETPVRGSAGSNPVLSAKRTMNKADPDYSLQVAHRLMATEGDAEVFVNGMRQMRDHDYKAYPCEVRMAYALKEGDQLTVISLKRGYGEIYTKEDITAAPNQRVFRLERRIPFLAPEPGAH